MLAANSQWNSRRGRSQTSRFLVSPPVSSRACGSVTGREGGNDPAAVGASSVKPVPSEGARLGRVGEQLFDQLAGGLVHLDGGAATAVAARAAHRGV